MCKQTIKKMLKNKQGKIINITSIVAHTGNLGQANYAASKAGIVGFSKSLAIEYARKKININCISPGFIKTDMTSELDEKKLKKMIPVNRFGTAEEVAHVVSFLASNKASYITGEIININGGIYS